MKWRTAALYLGIVLASGPVMSSCDNQERERDDPHTNDRVPADSAQLAQSDWSAPVDGVRGRLVVTPIDSAGVPQFTLELELENVSDAGTPIEIWSTELNSILNLSVEDETGRTLPGLAPPGHGMHPGPQWLPLMHQSSVKVVIAKRAYQYGPGDKVWLRPAITQGWMLDRSSQSSRLFINGVVRPSYEQQPRDRAWRGPLILPRVEIPSALREGPLLVKIGRTRTHYTTDAQVEVTFRNTGKDPIRILNEFDRVPVSAFFAFRIVTDAGRRIHNIPLTTKVQLSREPALRYVQIKENEEFKITVSLETVLPRGLQAGEYTVSAVYHNQYGVDCFQGRVQSDEIKIKLEKK